MNRQILEEASAWFVDFRVGDVDAGARSRFDEWLRRSPEHIRAYMEVAQTYVDLPSPDAHGSLDVARLIASARAESNVVPLDATAAIPTLAAPKVSHGFGSLTRGRLAASIAIVGLLVSALAWFTLQRDSIYVTEIGERRTITLADGSTMDLNARSRVRVHFSKAERYVELLDGQALFQVAKEKARPFIVRSGATRVRAVGTQFEVDRRMSSVTVTVVEGRVTVLTEAPPRVGIAPRPTEQPNSDGARGDAGARFAEPTYVSAGEQITVADGVMASPRRANIAETTAWMQHRLIFDGSRLGDVVDEFNRYNRRQLVIEEGALENLHISGVYSSTDPASLIRFLREQPGIQIVESDQVVRISRP